MRTYRADRPGRVNVFPIDGRYLFRHYFESDPMFETLRPYYESSQYRLAVPKPEYYAVRMTLVDHGYRPTVVEAFEKFVVIVRKHTAPPDNIFKATVYQWSVGDRTSFLLADRQAVEETTSDGAIRLEDSTAVSSVDIALAPSRPPVTAG